MKRIFPLHLALMFFILGFAGALSAQDYEPDQVIVNGATPAQLASLGTVGVKAAASLGRGGDRLITLRPGMSVKAAAALLEKLPNVKYACPNYIRKAADTTPGDPFYGNQWAWPKIQAPLAWDTTRGSANITVAVVDTGVDLDHPDLLANLWVNQREYSGTAGVDDDGNGYTDDIHGWNAIANSPNPNDDDVFTPGHGTHCAGTIGAASNAVGGVGANWTVRIMALKFLNLAGSGYDADAIECIDYAIATKAAGSADVRILSNSWSSFGGSPALQAAIERARDAGMVFVAAAGNESFNIDSPACVVSPGGLNVSNIVTVVASDESDNKAVFSNFGRSKCALSAPGINIYNTAITVEGLSTYRYSSASAAASHVSGVLALILAVNPTLTVNQLIDRLLLNVDPVVADPINNAVTATGGRLNAARAVNNTPNSAYNSDWDGDFIPNHWDNCPYVGNPGQVDTDGDGVGDDCAPPAVPCPGFGCTGPVPP